MHHDNEQEAGGHSAAHGEAEGRRRAPSPADSGADDAFAAWSGSARLTEDEARYAPGGSSAPFGMCPECSSLPWPGVDEESASVLASAAASAFLRGVDAGEVVRPDRLAAVPGFLIETIVQQLVSPAPGGDTDAGTADAGLRVVRELETIVQQLVPPAPGGDTDTGTADAGPWVVRELAAGRSGKIVRLLKHWRDLGKADGPALLVVIENSEQYLHPVSVVAACAVRAAYHARAAVVHEQPAVARPMVAAFARRWFGLRPTDANIDAVTNALLQAPLDGVHPEGDHAAVRRLKADAKRQRRWWRPLSRTRARGV
ncbi:MAG TPA: hypothetical protein VF468_21320, partial [Actinomycetota bacterium]|nr:hypothetical protein [Actinomycetota bacterium]